MNGPSKLVAQATPAPVAPPTVPDDSPEAKMARRFPQKVRVGFLVGMTLIEYDRRALGQVKQVVRTPEGKIELIVLTSRRFGWSRRLVAVPIEVIGILGQQVKVLDISADQFGALPTWTNTQDSNIADDQTILIALTKS
jgi:hypothetical protein